MPSQPNRPETASNPAAIIGGHTVSANTIFATVALTEGDGFFCSGVLIAPTIVLTAGHCVDGEVRVLFVRAGALNVAEASNLDGHHHEVKAIHFHPDFDFALANESEPNSTDLAVLELSTPVTAIKPVLILPPSRLAALQGEEPIVVAGYGNRGEDGPSGVLFEGETFRYLVTPDTLYIGSTPRSRAGDSGSPAYVVVEDQRWLLGVNSGWGSVSIYALVSPLEAWIRTVTNGAYSGATEPADTPEPSEMPEPAGTPEPSEIPDPLDVGAVDILTPQPSTKSGSCHCELWPQHSQPLSQALVFLVLLAFPRKRLKKTRRIQAP